MINVLFICSQNKLRSPTAEHVFAKWPNVETDSAGLNAGADVELSPEQIAWVKKIIFVMEKKQWTKLSSRFRKHLNGKKIICLDIPDDYDYMQAELVTLLEAKAGQFLRCFKLCFARPRAHVKMQMLAILILSEVSQNPAFAFFEFNPARNIQHDI